MKMPVFFKKQNYQYALISQLRNVLLAPVALNEDLSQLTYCQEDSQVYSHISFEIQHPGNKFKILFIEMTGTSIHIAYLYEYVCLSKGRILSNIKMILLDKIYSSYQVIFYILKL